MKLISALIASTLALSGAEASELQPKELRGLQQGVQKPSFKDRDFGVYRILPSQTGAEGQAKAPSLDKRLVKGTRVENVLTGKQGLVTGKLAVLAERGTDVHGLARELGVVVEASESRTGLYLLDASNSADLAVLKATLADKAGIRRVKIDVRDNRNREY
ncbi:hypothetical protein [Gallaecimonas sp. GXIMD4217]|uniref:hypothetical protein n=1 Tax=Gallaecimonas sp. GXIMD4217 TaxID=3131927 RepID=UPI00311AE5D1